MSVPLSSLPVRRGLALPPRPAAPEARPGLFDWTRLAGRVSEISEAGRYGALSALCGVLAQGQARGEALAWVAGSESLFYPPDLAFRGVDLGALTVVRPPDPAAALLAADWLLRSAAFGLVVLDWEGGTVDEAFLGRLGRLAEQGRCGVVFLTRKRPEDPSVGTLLSLRGAVLPLEGGALEAAILRDKRSGPPSRQRLSFHGPSGLY